MDMKNITSNQELTDYLSQFTVVSANSDMNGTYHSSSSTGLFDTSGNTFTLNGNTSNITLGTAGIQNCLIGGCNTVYYPYYSYPLYTQTDDPNKLVIENVENGFVLRFKNKVYVATKEENLFKLITKLNDNKEK